MNDNTTLQQGIDQFRKRNGKYFSDKKYSEEGEEFIRCHDVAHVVFGCDTTIYGEGVVKIWTTFGTTLSFWEVTRGYKEVSAFTLFKMYSVQHVLRNLLSYLWVIPKVIVRAKRMRKPWPFLAYQPFLDTPIAEIRDEFNIQVLS
ncbi:Coq4 family protein [Neolewinella persica]|uniref:Coq4 family protein n=1 Tax=Neolewinella persica TaxID=70998 RepID=UPI00036D1D3B|nr:Coq4 family protein [Neolewinella persica]